MDELSLKEIWNNPLCWIDRELAKQTIEIAASFDARRSAGLEGLLAGVCDYAEVRLLTSRAKLYRNGDGAWRAHEQDARKALERCLRDAGHETPPATARDVWAVGYRLYALPKIHMNSSLLHGIVHDHPWIQWDHLVQLARLATLAPDLPTQRLDPGVWDLRNDDQMYARMLKNRGEWDQSRERITKVLADTKTKRWSPLQLERKVSLALGLTPRGRPQQLNLEDLRSRLPLDPIPVPKY